MHRAVAAGSKLNRLAAAAGLTAAVLFVHRSGFFLSFFRCLFSITDSSFAQVGGGSLIYALENSVKASDQVVHPYHLPWSHSGNFSSFDIASYVSLSQKRAPALSYS